MHIRDLVLTYSTVLNFRYKCRNFGNFSSLLDTSHFLTRGVRIPGSSGHRSIFSTPLSYIPWKSLASAERQWALKELQSLSKVQAQLTVRMASVNAREPREWRTWNNMQPSERQSAFMKLQKDQKASERGEVKQQISNVPANKSIVFDDDGTTLQPIHPRALAKIKREAQGPPNAIKNEIQTPHEVLTRNSGPSIAQRRKIKKEHVHLDHGDLSAGEPLAKRQKIKQESTDINVFNNVRIKQRPTDLDAVDEKAIVLKKEATIKYDLTELEDAVILPEPSPSSADCEDSIYLEIAEEVLRQTAAEFVQTREQERHHNYHHANGVWRDKCSEAVARM